MVSLSFSIVVVILVLVTSDVAFVASSWSHQRHQSISAFSQRQRRAMSSTVQSTFVGAVSATNKTRRPHKLIIQMTVDPKDDDSNQRNNHQDDNSVDEQINEFLDKPFFNPDDPSNDTNWFANLVKNDYDSAESLYVGIIVIIGVVVSQELLRIVKYGGGYVPFGGGGGKLF